MPDSSAQRQARSDETRRRIWWLVHRRRALCHKRPSSHPRSNQEQIMRKLTLSAPMKKLTTERAGRHRIVGGRIRGAGAGRRGRQDVVQQVPGLPRDRRRRQEQGRRRNSTGSTAASPAPRRTIITRTPTRIPASPGTRPSSRNTSRTRRRRFPAPRWRSPASRTRRRSTISGPMSRNTTRTERPSKQDQHQQSSNGHLRGHRWPVLEIN